MTLDHSAALDSAHGLTAFAADLTDAAYSVALRHGSNDSWIELQLDVWRAIAASVAEVQRSSPRSPSASEYLAWRDEFLSKLTDAAYRTVLYHGFHGRFLDVELDLYVALREVIERSRSNAELRFLFGAGAKIVAEAVLERLEQQAPPPQVMYDKERRG